MKKYKYEILSGVTGTTFQVPIFLEASVDEMGIMVGFDGEIEQIEQFCNFTYKAGVESPAPTPPASQSATPGATQSSTPTRTPSATPTRTPSATPTRTPTPSPSPYTLDAVPTGGWEFSSVGGVKLFEVYTNAGNSWTVNIPSSATWLSVLDSNTGTGEGAFALTAEPNGTGSLRSISINITSDAPTIYLSISQQWGGV